ncbi:MAG: DinB family protein [Bacteroidota bacterium]
MNQVLLSTEKTFGQLKLLLSNLNNDDYSRPLVMLTNNTVGKHVRHIIEMYHCLMAACETGVLDYDKRERNIEIENNISVAVENLDHILVSISNTENHTLSLNTYYDFYDTAPEVIPTNFHRELAFALEHCIHHMAIIRIAVESNFSYVTIAPEFGVATSTLRYLEQCAQ